MTNIPLTRSEVAEIVDNTKTTAAKAWVAGAIGIGVAFLSGLTVALTGDNVITPVEWTVIGTGTLVAAGTLFGGVYATPNRAKF